ncbi:MetQ/NlpA family ABC transporter substrate-binding protein [Planococcus glaciei]|uniref:MetQ/NlpA family ABC transporter substrate-binding protein n=1 Tax=Planococcus glaciei TaxID=459472 RepID=UPI001C7321CB|nr:MetQ/NlpA family ABC transporter substrate-binding protein [Planococcus glaciei]MBX0314347.1 MetQ/NlpA family ABC transporter substrate-binding protein [Planococcus glaciei]MCP2033819.1 D-methionine transport system substrate-binding protein [Planomicrobium sp. HSC-17F08]
MKKITSLLLLAALVLLLAACGGGDEEGADGNRKVTLGISGSDTTIWDYIGEKAEKEGIELEIVTFSDYVAPNMALAEGELDLNAFQTISYFDEFVTEHKLDIVPIGSTVIAPMGLYSEKYKTVDELPDGAQIALPNEATNMGRGLLLLQEAGLIKLSEDAGLTGTADDIIENPKNIELVPMISGQTPRAMADVAASIINNGVAVDAGLNPSEDPIARESETAAPYINLIAASKENADDPDFLKIVELYQQDDTAEFIKEHTKGAQIPTFVPVEELVDYQ